MNEDTLKDKAAIVGVGWSKQSRDSGVSPLSLVLDASLAAIKDSGLRVHDIDSIVMHGRRDGPMPLVTAAALGLPLMRYFNEFDAGGYGSNQAVITAAMAVACGLANYVLVYRGMNGRSGPWRFGLKGGSSLGAQRQENRVGDEDQFQQPFGWSSPPQIFAFKARLHMNRYGTTYDQLGAVAVTTRYHATMNERAVMHEPLTMQQHHESRWIVEPFRLFDCALETDGACAMVVTTAERARDLPKPPVYIMAAAHGAGTFSHGGLMWPDDTQFYSHYLADELYGMAGIGPEDVDVAEIYDCFTISTIAQLEDFKFCKKGEGGPFVESGAIRLGGKIPTNTHGGLLSEAYLQGMGHVCEAVSQLRGEAGPRQVQDAEIALTTGQGGHMGGALILRR